MNMKSHAKSVENYPTPFKDQRAEVKTKLEVRGDDDRMARAIAELDRLHNEYKDKYYAKDGNDILKGMLDKDSKKG